MGAWGSDPFENDDAGDWSYQLLDGGGPEVVAAALSAAGASEGPQEAPQASATVGAASLVALACGLDVPVGDELRGWITATDTEALKALRPKAAQALARVLADSELADLWDEVGDETWRIQTEELRRRLASTESGADR